MSSAPKNPRIFKSRKDLGFRIPEFGFLNLDFNFFRSGIAKLDSEFVFRKID